MAERAELPGFLGGSYTERSSAFDSERSINLYPVIGPQSAKSPLMLVGTPGLDFIFNLGNSPIRGIHKTDTYWYVVTGNQVWQLDLSLTVIQATGILNTSDGLVSMAHNNNNQLAIVDGQNLYICTTGTLSPALTTITTNILGKPNSICFLNQYFIIGLLDTQQFQWSALNDGTSWGALDFDFATNSPDILVAVATSNGYLYLLGTDTTEVWSNNPTQTTIGATTISFPFNWTGTIIPFGLAGAHAMTNINNGLAWLTGTVTTSPHIIFTQGASEELLSTPAIEQLIASYGNFSNAFCMVSHQQGSETFILSFPSNNSTICYDFQTKIFHERSSYNGQVWLPSAIESFGTNVEIAGDSTTGNVYYLDQSTYTDNGQPILRTRVSPHYASKDEFNFCYELIVQFEKGIANANPPGNDPVACVECSTDYGKTYDFKRSEKLGKRGEYFTQISWKRFGRGRDFVFKLTTSEPIPIRIIKAWSEFETGIN